MVSFKNRILTKRNYYACSSFKSFVNGYTRDKLSLNKYDELRVSGKVK